MTQDEIIEIDILEYLQFIIYKGIIPSNVTLNKVVAEIESLRAKLAVQPTSQDVIDAGRYRFMRETNMTDIYSDLMNYKLNPLYVDFVDLNVAIDFAMKESK